MAANGSKQMNAHEIRLHRAFLDVLHNRKQLKLKSDARNFITGIRLQEQPTACLDKIRVSPKGLDAIQQCLSICVDLDFLNGPATDLLRYLQEPSVKNITGGSFLDKITLTIVHPAFFWDPFVEAFREGKLKPPAVQSFAWLLQQCISLPSDKAKAYIPLAQDKTILQPILDSQDLGTRNIGAKIKHILSTISQPQQPTSSEPQATAGGRHDNDYVDFREINILPTADELLSEEKPFLRLAAAIESPDTAETRPAIHLENQFRLLREDMVDELRREVQLAVGKKKGRSRRLMINSFYFLENVECGTHFKRQNWAVTIECMNDLPQFQNMDTAARKQYLKNNKRFVKHQSLACLIADGQVVSFPTIIRDEDKLCKQPPVLILQFPDGPGMTKMLHKIHYSTTVQLIQLDTALFAYEPILKSLQCMREIPLSQELLYWEPGTPLVEPEYTTEECSAIEKLRSDPLQDLQTLLQTSKSIKLDESQARSFITGLTQRVSLIQGPPGTGKSFLGALIAKSIYLFSSKKILVCVYTNHALDQFLEDLLDIGIPGEKIVRLGGKSTQKTEPLMLSKKKPPPNAKLANDQYFHMVHLRDEAGELERRLQEAFEKYCQQPVTKRDLMEHIEVDDSSFWEAFQLPGQEDGMTTVGKKNKAVDKYYLLDEWMNNRDAGAFRTHVQEEWADVWKMTLDQRRAKLAQWQQDIITDKIQELENIGSEFNSTVREIDEMNLAKDGAIIQNMRIVACTTTAAAKYTHIIQNAEIDVVLVEEAGEILESHVLTALGPQTNQMVLIGDHQQLRPKVNNYTLTVEKGEGYDLNRSLFERLVLKNYPHEILTKQHRMRPEISRLVRELTYAELEDAPSTKNRLNVKGLQDNLIFIHHNTPEQEFKEIQDRKDMNATSSKKNVFEVRMILKFVKYLAQQGYGTEKLVVLTPYLAQLQELRKALMTENDPVLNDIDSFELVRAGLMSQSSAKLAKNPIRLATIDNFQGEEGDIVIISLTRSNDKNDIGFMISPQRLNVLLSRARDGMIIIGNADTFRGSRKGGQLWKHFFDLMNSHIYDGLPIQCQRHPDRKITVCSPADFNLVSPEGGCTEPCNSLLSCNVHKCPLRCHKLDDHSKMQCQAPSSYTCDRKHTTLFKCHKGKPSTCEKCEKEDKDAYQKLVEQVNLQDMRDRQQKLHEKELADIEAKIKKEEAERQDLKLQAERAKAIAQKKADLAEVIELKQAAADAAKMANTPAPQRAPLNPSTLSNQNFQSRRAAPTSASFNAPSPQQPTNPTSAGFNAPSPQQPANSQAPAPNPTPVPAAPISMPAPATTAQSAPGISTPAQASPAAKPWPVPPASAAKTEWERQKFMDNVSNRYIDELMGMIGLEEVKDQVLKIKNKVDITKRQGTSLKGERFNISLLGNPGTGKTTVARLYAKFLASVDVLPGTEFVEATGASLANDGVSGIKGKLDGILKAGGGTLFIDEAYQLTTNPGGNPVLGYLLAEIENNVGKLIVIVAGYKNEMEKFFEHNPGLPSRFPYALEFRDYTNPELLQILQQVIQKKYLGNMGAEDGLDGLYMRIVITRIGRGRGTNGFGNARMVQNVFAKITERQAQRVAVERKEGKFPSDFWLTKEDMIGPDPSKAVINSDAWKKLQDMIGIESVKKSVHGMIDRIQTNYERELREQAPIEISLNRQFLGSPGTGKTTVAKLYGQILADLGVLSNGQVLIKNPSDFIGSVIGESEKNTKGILAAAAGKVLVIDEAYMLYQGGGSDGGSKHTDTYRTAVIDTLVAEVQNVPGEDRCVLLLGYDEQMDEMFQNVNPGLTRRFPKSAAFHFDDFTQDQLAEILDLKLKNGNLYATDAAKKVALDVLDRKKNQLNFGNGGEVENILTRAKELYLERNRAIPVAQRPMQIVLEPVDFDPDYDRASKADTNLDALFADVVGGEDVKNKLRKYQQTAAAMKARGNDPRKVIPFNFVFKGPPGTGKTTTARKIGQVFCDMGFLSSAEVVECSATDLVGQYIGQTGPKTRKKVESALGKVLFIDEAYRLGQGHFSSEAMDELVDLLTKPQFLGKIIVILAGYEQDINRLLSVNQGLSSRFSEEIFFHPMSPEASLVMLSKVLAKEDVLLPELGDKTCKGYKDMMDVLKELVQLPSWGNGRDIQTLGKNIVQEVNCNYMTSGSMAISPDEVVTIMKTMLKDRRDRATKLPSGSKIGSSSDFIPPPRSMSPPPPPKTATATSTKTKFTPSGSEDEEDENSEDEADTEPEEPTGNEARDPGVSDAVWHELQRAKKIAEEKAREYARLEEERLRNEAEKARIAKVLADLAAKAKAEADARERARIAAQMERERQLRERAEAERKRLEALRLEKEKEARAQARLRSMGVCPAGFHWYKEGAGYRCGGGSHWISDAQIFGS